MSEYKLISPLLDDFIMGDPISDHNGIQCCPAMKNDTGDKYIVKIISIPASPTQLEALTLTGIVKSDEEIAAYLLARKDEVVQEIELLQQLSGNEGYLPYAGYQVVPKENTAGFDIYILSSYHQSLERYSEHHSLSQKEGLTLGVDICTALTTSRAAGYQFINLKPSNIYITENREFRISDLGFLAMNSLKFATIPQHYISTYTAPEVPDAFASPSENMDVYGLGMILYEIFNGGVLPRSKNALLRAPQYADEELSAIIMKACAPQCQDRWPDPAQMGQALVNYMQNHDTLDVPIILPTTESASSDDSSGIGAAGIVGVAAAGVAAAGIGAAAAAGAISEEALDIIAEIDSLIPEGIQMDYSDDSASSDTEISADDSEIADIEAAVEENIKAPYEDAIVEISDILEQADILAAMEVPEPVVVPEPTTIQAQEETPSDMIEDDEAQEDSSQNAKSVRSHKSSEEKPQKTSRKIPGYVKFLIVVAILAGIVIGGYFYVKLVVIKTIDNLEIIGNKDRLTVKITAQIDDSMLTVSCKDTYGKVVTLPVVNDTVEFSNLLPNSDYTITVNITGFHILTGKTEGNYFTPLKTTVSDCIIDITETTGSAYLTFRVNGPDSKQWKFTYGIQGHETTTVTFEGHEYMLTGLLENEVYNGYLEPVDDLFIDESEPITFTANQVIEPENVQITSCAGGKLHVEWNAPEGILVNQWIVRCYNSSGFDITKPTKNNYYTFTVPDSFDAYTVEVSAEGQMAYKEDKIEKNTVTVTFPQRPTTPGDGFIHLSWTSESTPEKGWIVSHSINGAPQPTISTNETTVKIPAIVTGAKYTFTVSSADPVETLVKETFCNTPEATDFSLKVGTTQYMMTDLQYSLCTRPVIGNWTENDDTVVYTETYTAGQYAGLIVFLNKPLVNFPETGSNPSQKTDDSITFGIIILDEKNNVVSAEIDTRNWNTMWDNSHCYINIPKLPKDPGVYTLRLTINTMNAVELTFAVKES